MLDFNTIKEMVDDDNDVIVALFTTYLEDYMEAGNKLLNLTQAQDWQALFLYCHSLKGTLKILGEEIASQHLENIEHVSRDNQIPEPSDVEAAKQQLDTIQSQMQHYLIEEGVY